MAEVGTFSWLSQIATIGPAARLDAWPVQECGGPRIVL
jgi:hypothetical protein